MSSRLRQIGIQIVVYILLFAPFSNSLAQEQPIEFSPYAIKFAGAPLTKENTEVFYQIKLKIRQLQSYDGPKNLLKMNYEIGSYGGVQFMKRIVIKVPHDQEYYQPIWLTFDGFDLRASNATKLYDNVRQKGYLLDIMDGEYSYFTTPNKPEDVTFKYKTAPFIGKSRNSPYSYTPEKKENVLIEMIIEKDRPKIDEIAEIFATKWCVFHQLNRAYQDYAYNVLVQYMQTNDLPSAFVKDGKDLSLLDPILEEVLNYKLPAYTAFKNDSKKPLGKYPAFEANIIDVSLLKGTSIPKDFAGKKRIKLDFGVFEGDYILSKLVKGIWKSDNGKVRINMIFDENENPIHIQYQGTFLYYMAFYQEGSDFLKVSKAITKEKFTTGGTLIALSGQIGERENTNYAYSVNELSELMDESIEAGNVKFSLGNSFRMTTSASETACSVLGTVDFSIEGSGKQAKLVAKARKGKSMTSVSSENGRSTTQETSVKLMEGYADYLANYLSVFNEVDEPKDHRAINFYELYLLNEALVDMRDSLRKEQIHPMGMAIYIYNGYGISKDPAPYFTKVYNIAARFQKILKYEVELMDYFLGAYPNSDGQEEVLSERAILIEGIENLEAKLRKHKGSGGSPEMMDELSIIPEEDFAEVQKIVNSWRMR